MIPRLLFLAGCLAVAVPRYHDNMGASNKQVPPYSPERTIQFWYNTSFDALNERLKQHIQTGKAKNIILFLGDGMSLSTITAARIYWGQLNNQTGEEAKLSFEKFPFTGLSKTYCVDSQVADSACSGTAFLSGVKGNMKTLGVTADVKYKDAANMINNAYWTPSILQWAQDAQKGTGIVTTCSVTDATPAAAYAHTASSMWQTDVGIKEEAPEYVGKVKDIATQLMENNPGKNIKVILGGGRSVFMPNTTQDEYGHTGIRGDGKDLINQWKAMKKDANVSARYVTSRSQLLSVNTSSTDYLLGLFHPSNFDYNLLANNSLQPTLYEMTSAAINVLKKEKNGYFLLVEGGEIDLAHHYNKAHIALDETVEFHKAIELAAQMTCPHETLIVVTADHAHSLSMSGYPYRGSDIINTTQKTNEGEAYSTLSYANGPKPNRFNTNGSQHDISSDNRTDPNYTFPSTYNLTWAVHDGQDVAVFARGPFAHLLVGTFEQTVIPHVMAYAAGIGPVSVALPKDVSEALRVTSSVLVLTFLQVFIFTILLY